MEDTLGFFWQDYLDATNTVEVPQIVFQHVEETLQNEIEIGMSLEVPTKHNSNNEDENKYWVASIVMACGPLLRLRYFGGDDRSLEFWHNLNKEAGHELGWSVKNNKRLEPPAAVLEKSPDCRHKLDQFLTKTKSIPIEILSGNGLSIIDRIKQGMKVEVSDIQHPYKLWVATIKENVGGRLLLQYDTPGSKSKNFWMFCTSEHLHRYGFASQADSNWFLEPPSSIVDAYTYEEWKALTENGSKNLKVPVNLFYNSVNHVQHNFKEGMKLEAVSPSDRTKVYPATVVKVFDNTFFLVQIDMCNEKSALNSDKFTYNANERNTWLCTAEHPYIFPVGWTKKNNISLTSPKNWTLKTHEFNWEDYLKGRNAVAADVQLFGIRENAVDKGFQAGMKLEAVDPINENLICAAHISKIVDNLLWIKLDNYDDRADHIVDMHSQKIFPVGWCESNNYPLIPPKDYKEVCKKVQMKDIVKNSTVIDMPLSESRSSYWCPKIYFNYRCFTGPMISKGKLATLPKAVGPGPVILVMREVLSKIVTTGYMSARILRLLQSDTVPGRGYKLEELKAKNKDNTCRANVAIITSGDMVAEFCKTICKKLMVCPNLFGPLHVTEKECPNKCHSSFKNNANGSKRQTQKSRPRRKKRRGRWANKAKELEQANRADTREDPRIDIASEIAAEEKMDLTDIDSPSSSPPKSDENADTKPRRDWDTISMEIDESDADAEYVRMQIKQRRPKTKKLESNPLFWTVDDVFRYLSKTADCKDLAHRVKQEEIDGLAFLLLNLPSLTEHMKLRTSAAMKLCRHVEQVKVTYFLKYIHDDEPEKDNDT